MLPRFDLIEPRSLSETIAALADGAPSVPLAGGTNLLVDLRAGRQQNGRLVGLYKLGELRRIAIGQDKIVIGAGTSIGDILRHAELATAAPSLVDAAKVFAGQMVRNAATVGGNICYGSPAADIVPPLLSLDAEVTLASLSGERSLPLRAFLVDYRNTALRPGELLTAVSWARPQRSSVSLFTKLGLRKGDAITVVGAALCLAVGGGKCSSARIALGAVAPTVLRAADAEELLTGRALTPAMISDAATLAAAGCRPIDDLRASAEYRRRTAGVLVRRLLTDAWARLQ